MKFRNPEHITSTGERPLFTSGGTEEIRGGGHEMFCQNTGTGKNYLFLVLERRGHMNFVCVQEGGDDENFPKNPPFPPWLK